MFSDTSSSTSAEDEPLVLRRPKFYRKRRNLLEEYDDVDFFDRFRLTKPTVLALVAKIENLIKNQTNRGGFIKPLAQVLLTLRFYASGNMQIAVADFLRVSRSSACRIIRKVSSAISSLSREYIRMHENQAEMELASAKFYEIARFPRVIGAIDCTLVKINSPGGHDAEIYRCRKGYFAINVQTTADADLKIRNIVARWPGSVHDQTIFNNSVVKQHFENGNFGRYMLIGDSGYTLQTYLMTKLANTRTPAENLYNESLIRTRNVVERQYGVLKRRFPVLSFGMRMKLDTILKVIVATAVLHNIAIDMNEHIPEKWLEDLDEVDDVEPLFDGNINNNLGRHFRQLLIDEYFATL